MARYREYESRIERLRQQRADLPISISAEEFEGEEDEDNSKEYICKHCMRRLVKIDDDGEWYCNHCSISEYPEVEDVRSKHVIYSDRSESRTLLKLYTRA